MHIKVLRLYTAISLAFALSFGFLLVSSATGGTWALYGYYINHISNPIIYWLFVDKFREQVREYLQKLRGRCCAG